MVYTPMDIKNIAIDTVGTSAVAVKDNIDVPIYMGAAGATVGIGVQSVKNMFSVLSKITPRRFR